MRIIAKKTLVAFWAKHPDARVALEAWYAEAKAAEWSNPTDIKTRYRHASILRSSRVVFNIGGNKYRLVAAIHYRGRRVYVRFIGTHKEYDQIDAEEI